MKSAVANAMEQAGLESVEITMATSGGEHAPTQREAEQCDIVIVGGGPAGLAAAIGAKQTNPELNVKMCIRDSGRRLAPGTGPAPLGRAGPSAR